ncbi:reverse transcriptase domain-containing protein [Tanacetum coccineum]
MGAACGQPMSHLSQAQGAAPPSEDLPPITTMEDMLRRPPREAASQYPMGSYTPRAPSGLFADYIDCVTPFVRWIEDYPLLDGLKLPSHVGSYDGKRDPDNFMHLFEGSIHMQKWAMPVACHMFTYMLKDSARRWWNGQKIVHNIKQKEGESTRAFVTMYTEDTMQILGLHEEQRISGFVHGLRTRSLVEFLTLGSKQKKSTNGTPNDHQESSNKFNRNSSWDNNKGRKNIGILYPYQGPNHGLLSNLSKSPREILATEKENRREWKKGDRGTTLTKAPVLMISRRNDTLKRKSTEESTHGLGKITFPPVSGNDNSSDPVIIKAKISGRLYFIKHSTIQFGSRKASGLDLGIGDMVDTSDWSGLRGGLGGAAVDVIVVVGSGDAEKSLRVSWSVSGIRSTRAVTSEENLTGSGSVAYGPSLVKGIDFPSPTRTDGYMRELKIVLRLLTEELRSRLVSQYGHRDHDCCGCLDIRGCGCSKKQLWCVMLVEVRQRDLCEQLFEQASVFSLRQLMHSFDGVPGSCSRSWLVLFILVEALEIGVTKSRLKGSPRQFFRITLLASRRSTSGNYDRGRAIKFHTPEGVGTVLLTYKPNKTREGQKKLKEASQEVTKDTLSCMSAEEEIVVNNEYPDQTVVIGRQLPTGFKKGLRDFLKANADIFAWTYADMMGIPRTIMLKCFLDAYKGYHQIPMAKGDEEKIAFFTREGVFYYKRLPFGLKNARATYQRLVDTVFNNQIGRNLEVHVDDIVIKSDSEEDMLADIQETFDKLRAINMKLNPRKCSFGVEEGPFLGYLITKQGIKANPSKVKAISDMKPPKTVKEIQSLNEKLAALSRFLPK